MSYKHGHDRKGMATPTYRSWVKMKYRCNNRNYKGYCNYGKRGIKVCERWNDFRNFLEDMGLRPDGLTLDRKDNNGNYEPGNCKWSTQKEQQNNRRPTSYGFRQQYWFVAFSSNDEQIISNNQSQFARIHGLDVSNMGKCFSGKYKQTQGWRFRKI